MSAREMAKAFVGKSLTPSRSSLPSPSSPHPLPPSDTPTSLSALIIGINNYHHRSIPNLRGAVNDAWRVREYLHQDLGVPEEKITYLQNENATRSNIIRAFEPLRTLERGTPVLVYYAGHGAKVIYGFEEVEAIIPYDCDDFWGRGTVPPIADKTLNILIELLYDKIGDNITVISDCCHSGGITRGLGDSGPVQPNVRQLKIPPSYRYPQQVDFDLVSKLHPGNSRTLAEVTHVLLAACSEREVARESPVDKVWQGDFTRALLALFRTTSIGRLAPADVMYRLGKQHISDQRPQCRGENRSRFFFNGEAPAYLWYRVICDDGVYRVNAGELHGISYGAKFRVYGDRTVDDIHFLGEVEAISVLPSMSTVLPSTQLRQRAAYADYNEQWFAVLDDIGHPLEYSRPRILLDVQSTSSPISRALASLSVQKNQHNFGTGTMNNSSFGIKEVGGQFFLFNLHERLTYPARHAEWLPYEVQADTDKLRRILTHTAHFFYHLDNAMQYPVPNGIQVEIREVGMLARGSSRSSRFLSRFSKPGDNIIEEGHISIMEKPDALYGIRILNSSEHEWYVTLLLFDGTQHTIDKIYGPGCGGRFKADPCLKEGGRFELGFDRSREAITFTVPQGRQRDFVVLKFIFTSTPVNFHNICSTSTLEAITKQRGMGTHDFDEEDEQFDEEIEWGTFCVPVIITKPKDFV